MRAMVLSATRFAVGRARVARAAAGAGANSHSRPCLRRLPDRSARCRWRVAEPEAAAGPRPRDRRHRGARSASGRALRSRAIASACPGSGCTCGICRYCRLGPRKPLRPGPLHRLHARRRLRRVHARRPALCFPIPPGYTDAEAAPLLCAGLIGYRSLVMAGEAQRLGLYGFGAAAHIIAQVARHQGGEVFAFTRPGDPDGTAVRPRPGGRLGRRFDRRRPSELDAAILFAPVGALVPAGACGRWPRAAPWSAPAST